MPRSTDLARRPRLANPRGLGLAMAALALLSATACDSGNAPATPAGGGGGTALTVTIDKPLANAWVLGLLEVSGRIDGVSDAETHVRVGAKDSCKLAEAHPLAAAALAAIQDGSSLSRLAARYGVKVAADAPDGDKAKARQALADIFKGMALTGHCKSVGPTFAVRLDTRQLDAKGKPVFKDGLVTLSVVSTSGDSAGGGSVAVNVDNTAPLPEILEPKPGQAFIGKLALKLRVTEKNLVAQRIQITDNAILATGGKPLEVLETCDEKAPKGQPNSCTDCRAKYKNKGGRYDEFEPICAGKPGTHTLTYDRGLLPSADVTIAMVAQDYARNARGQGVVQVQLTVKMLKPPTFDVAASRYDPAVRELRDYALHDYDGDGCLDLVLCDAKGLFVRPARHRPPPDQDKCSADWLAAVSISGMACKQVAIADLDPPDKKADPKAEGVGDIVALGTDGSKSVVQVFLTRPGAVPRSAQYIVLPGKAQAMAIGQLDGTGPEDLAVGSTEDKWALSVLLAHPDPLCPTKAEPARRCREIEDLKKLQPNTAQLLGSIQNKQTYGQVKALAIDDFVVDADQRQDIAIGRSTPVVTVCRNKGGGVFNECLSSGAAGPTAGMSSTDMLIAYNWTAAADKDTIPDLIVGSRASGVVRWLRGVGDGTFVFANGGQVFAGGIKTLTLVPKLGPGGEDMVVFGGGGRTVAFENADGLHAYAYASCHRALILGGAIERIRAGDVDADGIPDLTGMDVAGPFPGITVALGKGAMRYHAADVLRVCSRDPGKGLFHAVEVGQFQVADVNNDGGNRPDLLIGSQGIDSTLDVCKDSGTKPAFMFHLYLNQGFAFSPAPRATEFAPYDLSAIKHSGAKTDGCGTSFGHLQGMELARLDQSGGLDLVFAYANTYSHGKVPEEPDLFLGFDAQAVQVGTSLGEGVNSLPKNHGCVCLEANELNNQFGEDSRPDKGVFCRSIVTDEKSSGGQGFTIPRGFGGGAPIGRASVIYLKNDDTNKPLGMGKDNGPMKPALMEPSFAQSGGIDIVAMTKVDYNHDGLDDIVTLMDKAGLKSGFCYLEPRLRLLQTMENTGRPAPVFFTVTSSWASKFITNHFAGSSVKPIQVEVDSLADLDAYNPTSPRNEHRALPTPVRVSYRIVQPGPLDIRAAGYCDGPPRSLFTLSANEGGFCAFKSGVTAGNQFFYPKRKCYAAGSDPQAFAIANVIEDPADAVLGCNDVAFGRKKSLGTSKGLKSGFDVSAFLPDEAVDRSAVEIYDVNDDGMFDILSVDATHDNIEVYLGSGTTRFVHYVRPLRALHGSSKLRVTDFNGDKCKDLFVQGKYGVAVYAATHCAPK